MIFYFYLWHVFAFYFLDKYTFIISSMLLFPILVVLHKQAFKAFVKHIGLLVLIVIFYFLISNIIISFKPLYVTINSTKLDLTLYNIMLIFYLGYAVYRYQFNFFISIFCSLFAKVNIKFASILYLDSKLVINNFYRLKYNYKMQSLYLKSLGKNNYNISLIVKQISTLVLYSFKELKEQEMVLNNLGVNEDLIISPSKVSINKDSKSYIVVWVLEIIIYATILGIK